MVDVCSPSPPGPHFTAIQTAVVSLATPLLLLGADLRVVFRGTAEPSVRAVRASMIHSHSFIHSLRPERRRSTDVVVDALMMCARVMYHVRADVGGAGDEDSVEFPHGGGGGGFLR